MTNIEAIARIEELLDLMQIVGIDGDEQKDRVTFTTAIKALEQEPVLDKIKAEIDAKFDDRPSNYNHQQRREFYNDVIAIIDKYRKEQR